MRCPEALARLGAYLDSELDTETTARINAHLRRCPACARRFEAERKLERALAARLALPEPGDEELFRTLLARATRRRLGWRPALAAVVLLLAAAAGIRALFPRRPSLLDLAVQERSRIHAGPQAMDRASLAIAEAHLLAPFPPQGYELASAHRCRLGGVPVRYVGLQKGTRHFAVYLLPRREAGAFAEGPSLAAGKPVARGEVAARPCGEIVCIVVGPGAAALAALLTKGNP